MTDPKVLLIITQDTKEEEARFVREILEDQGCKVIHLDPSVRRTVGGAEIPPEEIALAGGMPIEAVRALGHEGKCQQVMMAGSVQLALETHEREGLSGIFSIGGSMGTVLGTAVMRAAPLGLPKLMVSTMASGFTAPYVGQSDIIMANSVCDISGLNSISAAVYRNAANAVAGMAKGYDPAAQTERPLILITTLGTTERCARRVREKLEADGFEVMVFHTSGNGGPTFDAVAAGRDVAAAIDMSLVEMVDYLNGGLCSAGPDRGKAAPLKGIPTLFVPGNCDFIIAGPYDDAVKQFPGKRYHVHNPALTAVRTEAPELKALVDHVAGIAAEAKGPVKFFVPLLGLSNHDSPEGHLHDLSLPPVLAEHAKAAMPPNVEVESFKHHINDPEFADILYDAVHEMLRTRATA